MPHLLEKRDPRGYRLGIWVFVCMAFALPFAVWNVARLRIDASMGQWLQDDTLATRQLAWYQQTFPADETVLISWENSTLEDPRLGRLAERLAGIPDAEGIRRGGIKQVATVQSPVQFINRLADRQIERSELVRRITGVMAGRGSIWCTFSTPALNQKHKSIRTLKESAAERFGIELQVVEPRIEIPNEDEEAEAAPAALADSTADAATETVATDADSEDAAGTAASAESTSSELAEQSDPPASNTFDEAAQHDIELSWRNMHGDSQQVQDFIAWASQLKLRLAGGSSEEPLLTECYLHSGQPVALVVTLSEAGLADQTAAFRLVRQAAVACGVPAESIHLAGASVEAAAFQQHLSDSVWNATAPWYVPQQRSIVLLSWFAALVLVGWKLRNARLSLLVGLTTTSAVLLTLSVVWYFERSLGVILLPVPVLVFATTLTWTLHLAKSADSNSPTDAFWFGLSRARVVPCLMAATGLSLGAGALMLSPSAVVRDFGFYTFVGMTASIATVMFCLPGFSMIWPIAPVPGPVVRSSTTFFGRLIVSRMQWITAASFIALVGASFGLRQLTAEVGLIQNFAANSEVVRDTQFVSQNVTGIIPIETVVCFGKEACEESSFSQRMEIVRSVTEKFRKLPAVTGALSAADLQPVSEGLEENASGKKLLAHNHRSLAIESQIKKDPLAKAYFQVAKVESEFCSSGDELWRISSQVNLTAPKTLAELSSDLDQACRSVTKYHPDTRNLETGLAPTIITARAIVSESLGYQLLVSALLFTISGAVMTQSLPAAVLALIPIWGPLAAVFGCIGWFGVRLDVSYLMFGAASVLLSTNGILLLMSGYREQITAGHSHRRAVVKSLDQIGPALWLTYTTIGVASVVLSQSQLLFLSWLSWFVPALLVVTLFGTLVLTPALLAGPLGWLILNATKKQRSRLKTVSVDPESGAPLRHEPHLAPPKPQMAEEGRHGRPHRFDEGSSGSRKKRK